MRSPTPWNRPGPTTARELATLLVLLGLLTGCRHSYERIGSFPPDLTVDRAAAAYVTMPVDFMQGGTIHYDSGKKTAAVLRNNLKQVMAKAHLAPKPTYFTNSLNEALARNCRYLFVPTILQWSDHSTHNSGLRDKLEIAIDLYELPGTNHLNRTELKCRSQWYGAIEEDVPEDLLIVPVRNYVMDLLRVSHPSPLKPDLQMQSDDPGF